ncbi:MAG: SDR family oxidoreductase [Alphaproteobacteria bacterium]|nr:SDR family oxidoreductase [Alphaproteobacteria bacterium]
MKKILVTGGCGFIGSNLCKKLLDAGNYVICIDNLFTGTEKNITAFKDKPNFKFIYHDVINPLNLEENIDEIYNLACPASPIHYQFNPIKTAKTSVFGALNMLELATQKRAKILQASTSEIYGDPEVHPQPEAYWGYVNSIGIRSCYDESKRMAETLFFDYHRQYSTAIKLIRIFNTYGPNMNIDDGRVISNFIVQALRNEDITVYGSGLQTRSFCYIDDLLEGMTKMMESDNNFIGPVNLGNPEEFTMLSLAELIISMTGSKSKIEFKPLPSDDPARRKPLIDLAKQKLKWEPKINLQTGLTKTIKYFESII